jgi:hypothetical protein
MQITTLEYLGVESLTHQRPATITTTLYDLIAALQDVVQPGEDALVVATMVHLLCTGRITLRSGIEALESVV